MQGGLDAGGVLGDIAGMSLQGRIKYWYLRYLKQIRTPSGLIRFAMARNAGRIFAREGAREISFDEVDKSACGISRALARRGISRGSVVATMMKNGPEIVEVRLAAYKSGFVFSAIIDDCQPDVVLELLAELEAEVLFIDAANLSRIDTAAIAAKTGVRLIVSTSAAAGMVLLDDLIREVGTAELPDDASPGDIAAVGFTSGTTGRSKGVVWSNAAWMSSFYNMLLNSRAAVLPDDVFLHVMPFSTAGSLVLLPCLAGGMQNVFVREYDPAVVCEMIEKYRITRIFLAPIFLVDLWDFHVAGGRKHDLSSLRNINVGSAPMYSAKYLAVQKEFGPILDHGYGMAEVLAPLTTHRSESNTVHKGRQLSVGYPAGHVGMRLLETDGNGRGRLAIRSSSMASGYWKRPELTAQHFADGWFMSNDMAFFDDAGRLYLIDRKDDLVERGGRKISLRGVEEVLHECDAVKDAAAIWKDGAIIACVTPRRGRKIDPAVLKTLCDSSLQENERPDRFVVMDSFPVSSSGKLLKRSLCLR